MLSNVKGEYFDSAFLFSALIIWILCASVSILIASIILNEAGLGEKSIGYISSAISFVSAAAAGWAAAKKRKKGSLYTAGITGAVLVTALLTIGFLVNGTEIEPSAVMSVVSFTFAGCMVGSVLLYQPVKSKKKYTPRP